MAREIARGDMLCEALLVSAYHRINMTGSAKTLHVRMQILTYFYSFKMP